MQKLNLKRYPLICANIADCFHQTFGRHVIQLFFASFLIMALISLPNKTHADFVNVNLASSFEIAEALKIKQKLAESISMHCEYITCRMPRDLLNAPGMTPKILMQIRHELIFDIVQRGEGYSDDC